MPRSHLLRIVAALAALLLVGQASFSVSTSGDRTVTVRPGDTLWGLSLHYGVPLDKLAAANGMELSDLLLIGRRLRLPGRGQPGLSASTSAAGLAAGPATSAAATPRPRHFTAADLAQMGSFCRTYVPPSGPVGALPSSLRSDPKLLALRPVFVRWARTYGVRPDLVEAIAWQESGWQNTAVSSANARGIGQLLPQTAVFVNGLLGTHLKLSVAEDNIRMEVRFLAFLLAATGNRVCEAVASYYQGFTTLQHIGVLPESQLYVRSVLGLRPRFQ
jgi:N-acetylmuramoyl-L-alanine amidase